MAVVILILLTGFYVAGEFSIVAVERSQVERRAAAGDRRAGQLLRSLRNLSFELSGAQLGITATSLVVGAIAEPAIGELIEPALTAIPGAPAGSSRGVSVALAIALATATQMVFSELVPKNLAIARPYRSALIFGLPMQLVNRVLRPVILLLNAAANWTVRLLGIEPLEELAGVRSMEELELMIRSSGEGGYLDDEELSLLTRAMSFTEKVAADAMVPRVAVIGVSRYDSVAEVRRLALETGHSRFPVYDTDLDEIIGVVHVKDTFNVPSERRSVIAVAEIAQAAVEVPETRPLDGLLVDLQSQGRTMAVVVDEYGGTAGIVTVEDLLEEIFGEIEDEHDPEESPEALSHGEAEVLPGLLNRHEVEERIGFEWPEGRYETLGGLVVATLGRFPRPGDLIRVDGWVFEVEAMDGHRVDRVRVTRPRPVDDA